MALYRETTYKKSNGFSTTQVVKRSSRSTPLSIDDGVKVKYYQKLTPRETYEYKKDNRDYIISRTTEGVNSAVFIICIIILLGIFANIDFSGNITFGELSDVKKLTIENILTTINNTADISVGEKFREVLRTNEFLNTDYTESNNILDILQSILKFFANIYNMFLFLIDLIISVCQILYSVLYMLYQFLGAF